MNFLVFYKPTDVQKLGFSEKKSLTHMLPAGTLCLIEYELHIYSLQNRCQQLDSSVKINK